MFKNIALCMASSSYVARSIVQSLIIMVIIIKTLSLHFFSFHLQESVEIKDENYDSLEGNVHIFECRT
jgi:hypothetical protein